MTSLSGGQHHAIYTQFCIGVELGDETLVRELVMRGADTMVSYGVDGVITTPMRTALKKGDMPMVLALLTSRSTKVKLPDLDNAPKIKPELITPMLLDRIARSLEEETKEALIQRPSTSNGGGKGRRVKISLPDSIAEHLRKLREADDLAQKAADEADSDSVSTTSVASSTSEEEPSLLKASPTDRPRCPPPQEEDEEDEEELLSTTEPSEEDDGAAVASSIASSAGDSSDLEDE